MEILQNLFCLPSENILFTKGEKCVFFFSFKVDPFSEGACCAGSNKEVTKVVALVNNGIKPTIYIQTT